jgi:hypothetical protein
LACQQSSTFNGFPLRRVAVFPALGHSIHKRLQNVQRFGYLEQIGQLYPLFLDTTGAVVSKLLPKSEKCKKTLEILDMMR